MPTRLVTHRNDLPEIAALVEQRVHRAVIDTTMAVQAGISAHTTSSRFRRALRRDAHTTPGHGKVFGVWWWYFREYGTRNQPAQPAVHPAVEGERARFYRRIIEAVRP